MHIKIPLKHFGMRPKILTVILTLNPMRTTTWTHASSTGGGGQHVKEDGQLRAIHVGQQLHCGILHAIAQRAVHLPPEDMLG